MYVCMYICMYMCVYVYMYMYVCIIYWGNCLGKTSYPKREGELSGGIVRGIIHGGIVLHSYTACAIAPSMAQRRQYGLKSVGRGSGFKKLGNRGS